MPTGESTQKVVKLDDTLWVELDKWLGTQDAKKLGYHSKAQFATQAIRELLKKSKYQRMLKDLKKFYSEEKGFDKQFQEVLEFTIKNMDKIKKLRETRRGLKSIMTPS